MRDGQAPGQIGEEDESALQYPYQENATCADGFIVSGDLPCQF